LCIDAVLHAEKRERAARRSVFDGSIAALQLLNSLGYGIDSELPLHLLQSGRRVFAWATDELEADYKRQLFSHFGIVFNKLYSITNMPIGRFAAFLRTIST